MSRKAESAAHAIIRALGASTLREAPPCLAVGWWERGLFPYRVPAGSQALHVEACGSG